MASPRTLGIWRSIHEAPEHVRQAAELCVRELGASRARFYFCPGVALFVLWNGGAPGTSANLWAEIEWPPLPFPTPPLARVDYRCPSCGACAREHCAGNRPYRPGCRWGE